MRRREMQLTGTIDNNGRLQMYMGELNEFFKMHKGKRVIATFAVAEKGSSEALKAYYYKVVVPTCKKAFYENGERMTDEQAEQRIRWYSPIMHETHYDIASNKYVSRLRTIDELSNAEFVEHIESIKQTFAEDYGTYIDDPRSI